MISPFQFQNRGIRFQNKSGEEIPPFACMELDLTSNSAIEESAGDVIVRVKKPTSSGVDSPALLVFNSYRAIADDDYGWAVLDPVFLAYWKEDGAGTPLAGSEIGAKAGEWFLTAAADGFSVKSFDSSQAYYVSATEQALLVERTGGSGGAGKTLYRFTLNEDMGNTTANQADADILEMDGTDTLTDGDVLDPLGIFSVLENGDAGICVLSDDIYYVIQAPCPGQTVINGGSL